MIEIGDTVRERLTYRLGKVINSTGNWVCVLWDTTPNGFKTDSGWLSFHRHASIELISKS